MSDPLQPALTRLNARVAPLSFAQERLWFIDAAAPGSPTYNVPLLVAWQQAADLTALSMALRALTVRHEILRTTYHLRDGAPVQEVRSPAEVPVELVDVSDIDESAAWVRSDALRRAAQGFNLSARPPIRCVLWHGMPTGDVMLLNIHHIAIDGWSLPTLFDDLADAYEQALGGVRPTLPHLRIQYGDFAAWDRASFNTPSMRKLVTDRVGVLKRISGELVLGHARSAARSREGVRQGAEHVFDIPAQVLSQVDDYARSVRATPFVVLFAAYQAVLQRWSGREEFLVGTIAANRAHADIEKLIGFFVNTVPLRCAPQLAESFSELCRDVRIEAFNSLTYQRIPFDQLTAALPASRGGVVTIGFALQNMPAPQPNARWAMPELLPTGTAKFDLILVLENNATGMRGRIEYDTDCHAAELAQRLAENFLTLLSAAVAEPDTALARLPLTRCPDRHPAGTLIGDLQDLHGATSVLDLTARRIAIADPDTCAVRAGRSGVSWQELDSWSWAVANYLASKGIGSGSVVPVLAARGPALVAAWLGALRTGAAYAPLGLDTPPDRLAHILAELDARAVIADEAGAILLAEHPGDIVRTDHLRAVPAAAPPQPVRPAGHEPAVVIYTSGTTGRPKGVLVPHGGLLNTTVWWAGDINLGPADRVLCTWSTSFDGATHEVFRSLIAGSELVFADDGERRDPAALAGLLREVTVTSMTPSLLRAVLESDDGRDTTLRVLYVGGEGLPATLARECLSRWGVPMRNIYGPTEASCISTYAPVDLSDRQAPAIGVPLPNTRCYILGQHQEELPVGVPGELYVAGAGVALGYLGQPERTQTAFLPDPYAEVPNARMYRTGDRVVLRQDGLIEYLGRADDQVKVLGNRIELDEVRKLIEEQPAVRAAAVQAEGEPAHLVAWVELADRHAVPTRDDVLRPLLRWLPAAVLPAEVYAVDALPITTNDKIDVTALAAMRSTPLPHAAPGEIALTPQQCRAARLFADFLGRDASAFGPDANFFTNGGHSLLAVKMLAAAPTPVLLRDFLADSTVAGLGALLAEGAGQLSLQAVDGDRFPATSAQQRFWLIDQVGALRAAYVAPVVTEFTGAIDIAALHRAVRLVVGRHPALRSRFTLNAKQRKVFYRTDGGPPEVRTTDAVGWTAGQLAEQLTRACWTPFDLGVDAPARAEIITSRERTLLVLAAHHIVTDGWSQQVLAGQIAEAYGAELAGGTPTLAEPVHPAALAAADASEQQVTEMVTRLAGAPTDVELPHDRMRRAVQSTAGRVCRTALDPDVTARLRAIGTELGCTTFMVTAALLGVALARRGKQRDFLFAFPWAGREAAASAAAVGMFVNTLVLRVDLRGEPIWRELLLRVRAHSTFCYRNADVPFDAVAAALHQDRNLSRPPLTPVYLTALPAPARPADLGPETRSRYLEPEPLHTKYELELTATDLPRQIELAASYASDLFDEDTVAELLESVVAAATDLTSHLDVPALKEI